MVARKFSAVNCIPDGRILTAGSYPSYLSRTLSGTRLKIGGLQWELLWTEVSFRFCEIILRIVAAGFLNAKSEEGNYINKALTVPARRVGNQFTLIGRLNEVDALPR